MGCGGSSATTGEPPKSAPAAAPPAAKLAETEATKAPDLAPGKSPASETEAPKQATDAPIPEILYLTGENSSGKTTMGQHIADTHSDWHCIDGDEFVTGDLEQLLIAASQQVVPLMRGSFEDHLDGKDQIEDIRKHDAEVNAAWEPLFRAVCEKLKQVDKPKIVFVYHIYRQSNVDIIREYFPTAKFVEVQGTRSLLLDRYVSRMEKGDKRKDSEKGGRAGVDLKAKWRDGEGEHMTLLRDRYGPEYEGNEEHFKKFVEWRYIFWREPVWEDPKNDFRVINNDNFDGAQELERMLA